MKILHLKNEMRDAFIDLIRREGFLCLETAINCVSVKIYFPVIFKVALKNNAFNY